MSEPIEPGGRVPSGPDARLPDDDDVVDRLLVGEASPMDVAGLTPAESRTVEAFRAAVDANNAVSDLWTRIRAAEVPAHPAEPGIRRWVDGRPYSDRWVSAMRAVSVAAAIAIVVVGGIAAQQATQADNRVIPPSPGESAGGHRNFECAGHTNDFDIFALCPAAQQSVACASKQPLGNELVKPGDDNAKMFSRSVEISLNRPYLNRGRGIERRILFMIVLRDPAPPWRNRSRTATTFTSP